MSNLHRLTTRYARRPHLLEPSAAEQIAEHLASLDPRGLQRESRIDAILRRIGMGRKPEPMAMDDDHYVPPPSQPAAYVPLWAEGRYGDPDDTGFGWSLYQGAALIEIDGALTDRGELFCGTFYHGYDTLLTAFREVAADTRVHGTFIRMNCPGGVAASGIVPLAEFIRENRAAAGGKPIHVYADLMCSAAYWIGAQADFISAGPLSYLVNVGAVVVHYDYSAAYAEAGIKVQPFTFGAQKADGAHWAPLSETAKASFQAEIDQIGLDFVADVVAGRPNLTAEQVIATEAAVFMGQHRDAERSAVAQGFADAVESEEAAFDRLLAVIADRAAAKTSAPSLPLASTEKETPEMLKPKQAKATKPAASSADDEKTSETGNDNTTADGETPEDGETDVDDEGADDDAAGGDDEATADGTASDAAAIAASAEGKANPAAALTAIEAGLSLDQFRKMSTVTGTTGRGGALREAMKGVKSVGLDAQVSKQGGSSLINNARARAGR